MDAPTKPARPASQPDPERFLLEGRLVTLPRRRQDKELVRRYLAARVIPLDTTLTEREVTERLARLADDPLGARRGLVEAGLLERTIDGAAYWRTATTEFD